MLMIVEGANGVGKSTLVERLVEAGGWLPSSGSTGRRVVRLKPFESFRNGGHWAGNGTGSDVLERHGVPFNTPVEDLFIADFIGAVGASLDFVLDRALPSALAYNALLPGNPRGNEMCGIWKAALRDVQVIPVMLRASHAVASGRLAPDRRVDKARHDWLQAAIEGWCEHMFGRVHVFDTAKWNSTETFYHVRRLFQ